MQINYAYSEGLARVDQLVDDLQDDDDGTSGVRQPRKPPPEAPGGPDALDPPPL